MQSPPSTPEIEREIRDTYQLYAALMHGVDTDTALGGKLLYIGELDAPAVPLMRAANIAGAASLAASSDAALLRRAMREGAVDFVVNSLDEALRILKNEIRKKLPVAVGVSVAPSSIESEMAERGVLPDLLSPVLPATPALEVFVTQGACRIQPQPLPSGTQLVVFPVPPDWSRTAAAPSAKFDELILECLSSEDHANRRWLRLSPRYLGVAARRVRTLACDAATAQRISAALTAATRTI